MYNRKNMHYWSRENPLRVHEGHQQIRFSFNCWCGILGDRIFLVKIYGGTLNTVKYLEILSDVFDEIDDLPLARMQSLYFQQDGAPAHNSLVVRERLNEHFGDNWIGTHGPVSWPARSPDLAPLDYFLWGYVKNEIYKTNYDTVEGLKRSLEDILSRINNIVIRNAVKSMRKRINFCIQENGYHFEHLIN